jgi:hypothetical protein
MHNITYPITDTQRHIKLFDTKVVGANKESYHAMLNVSRRVVCSFCRGYENEQK